MPPLFSFRAHPYKNCLRWQKWWENCQVSPASLDIQLTKMWLLYDPLFLTHISGWSGVAKVSRILRHRGGLLILAYSWARLAILVPGKGRGECFYFFCFFPFIPVPLSYISISFISSYISSISLEPRPWTVLYIYVKRKCVFMQTAYSDHPDAYNLTRALSCLINSTLDADSKRPWTDCAVRSGPSLSASRAGVCVCVWGGGGGGGGGNGGNCGTDVRASISKPTPFIYLAFEKTYPFIYLIIRNADLFIYCPLIFVPIYCR